jgi:hypothetical protein
MPKDGIGASTKRREDVRFLTGAAIIRSHLRTSGCDFSNASNVANGDQIHRHKCGRDDALWPHRC